MVWVNHMQPTYVEAPWGGMKMSGTGRELGRYGVESYGMIGFLKAGLHYADRITTVSRTYATEIQTPEHGLGLDGLLRARAEVVGLSMHEGLFRRQERVALLGLGLLFHLLAPAMWIMAILSNLTALQRFWMISRELRRD